MPQKLNGPAEASLYAAPPYTLQEILQQPSLWPATLETVLAARERLSLAEGLSPARVLLTGAGTSAHAASSVASAWLGALAVPTTDLLIDTERHLFQVDALISLARSGDSPESAAVVERVRSLRPAILQLAIVCNQDGALSQSELDGLIVLDPRTNDRSVVMTSAFSNLVLAGLVLAQPQAMIAMMEELSRRATLLLPVLDEACKRASVSIRDRIVLLSSSPLVGWGREAGLKVLEMTAGRFPVYTETYLGLRHGPMSFIKPDTVVVCLLSNDPVRRLYEEDLIRELRKKKIGYLIGIADPAGSGGLFDEVIPAVAPDVDDALRTPYEIMAAQLLGFHLSLSVGLNPDNPSPDGVIHRVVQGVRIYPAHPVQTAPPGG